MCTEHPLLPTFGCQKISSSLCFIMFDPKIYGSPVTRLTNVYYIYIYIYIYIYLFIYLLGYILNAVSNSIEF